MSGVDIGERADPQGRAGCHRQVRRVARASSSRASVDETVQRVARQGSTPLVVADGARVLGVIELKDIVKGGIKERFADLRHMGIKTIMITGRQSAHRRGDRRRSRRR